MIYTKNIIFILLVSVNYVFSQSSTQLKNQSDLELRRALMRDQNNLEQIDDSDKSLDELLELEERFDSTNVPIKIIVAPKDIEEYYRLKLKRIKEDIIGLNVIESLLDTVGSIEYFGYDYFYNFEQRELWERAIPPNKYILGAGDEVIISIWGQTERREKKIIGRDGKIFINDIGQLQLGGKSLNEAQEFIEKRLSRVYETIKGNNPQTYVDISHGKISGKTVAFTGYVKSPGFHVVTPYVDPISSLIYAGGIDTTGTLREILFYRNGIIIDTLDVYDYLIDGFPTNDLFIRDGDRIHVPRRIKNITLSGEVLRPAHYEVKSDETLLKAINYAGGLKNENTALIHLKRISSESGKIATESKYLSLEDLGEMKVNDGDSISVSNFMHPLEYIYIYGIDNDPIRMPYEEKMIIQTVVNAFGGTLLNEKKYKWSSEINYKSEDRSVNYLLKDIISGKVNLLLSPNDQITFTKNNKYTIPGTVKITGAINNAGSYPVEEHGEALRNLIVLAGGKRVNALSLGIHIYRDSLRLGWQNDSMLILPGDSIDILYDQGTIEILGEVNVPGIYEIGDKSVSVNKAISMAGGINSYGSKKNIFVVYPNGMVQSARQLIGGPALKSGSTLFVSSKSPSEYQSALDATEKLAGIIGSFATLVLVINSATTN